VNDTNNEKVVSFRVEKPDLIPEEEIYTYREEIFPRGNYPTHKPF
jgi:hypothetical protein